MSALAEPYRPKTDIVSRLRRRSARVMACDTFTPELTRGVVSFSFDDCPASVTTNALPVLEARDWRGTIYAAMGLNGTTNHLGLHMSTADYQACARSGHEVADHTYSHLDPMRAGVGLTLADVNRNRAAFDEAGLPPATTFAFPYGEVTPALKRGLRAHFDLLRGIHSPSDDTLDLSLAASQRLYMSSLSDVAKAIEIAARDRLWLILFTHDVREEPSEFGCTPEAFAEVTAMVAERDLDVLPIAEALERARP